MPVLTGVIPVVASNHAAPSLKVAWLSVRVRPSIGGTTDPMVVVSIDQEDRINRHSALAALDGKANLAAGYRAMRAARVATR
jgi:hypothetical protein